MARRQAGWDLGMGVQGDQPGIRFVEFRVPVGTARGAGRFYEEALGAHVVYDASGKSEFALTAVDASDPLDILKMNSPYLVRLGVGGEASALPFCHTAHPPYTYTCPKVLFSAAAAAATLGAAAA